MLTDFFAPLGPLLIVFSLVLFMFFDILGSFIDRYFVQSPRYLRPVIWLYGLGFFVFLWFGLHFFLPFDPAYIFASILGLLFFTVPSYLKCRSWSSLTAFVRSHPLTLLLFIILLPALWVKSSLPPYLTDEIRYHFLSPLQIKNQLSWPFGSFDLYTQLPKLIETIFSLIFAVSKTYAPARLLHFLIFYSSLCAIHSWLKVRFSPLPARLFLLIGLFLMKDLLIIATSGYQDYSVAILTTLGIILFLDAVLTKKSPLLLPASIFWGLSLATKYTPLSALTIFGLLTTFWLIKSRVEVPIGLIFRTFLFFTIFGGYWYVKNLLITQNPIFPFLFPCRVSSCPEVGSLFEGWTLAVNLRNLPQIYYQLSAQKWPLAILVLPGLLLSFKEKHSRLRLVSSMILLGIVGELVFIRFFAGFLLRYFIYLPILLTILVVLPAHKHRHYGLLLFLFALVNAFFGLKTTYSIWQYLSPQEIAYARGKTNIMSWIADRHRFNRDLIDFCGQPPDKTIYFLDETAWHPPTNEQYPSIFNIHCYYASLPPGLTLKTATSWATPLVLVSSLKCEPSQALSDLNQYLICHSQVKGSNLYLFDPLLK